MSKSRADTKGKYIDAKGEKGKEDFYAFEKKIIGYRHVSHFDAHFDFDRGKSRVCEIEKHLQGASYQRWER